MEDLDADELQRLVGVLREKPLVVEALDSGAAWEVYDAVRTILPQGVAGHALLALIRSTPDWDLRAQEATEQLPIAKYDEHPTVAWDAMTEMQRQVLFMLGEGLTHVDVALALDVSHKAVHGVARQLYVLFAVSTRVQLLRQAARQGLLSQ